MMEIEMSEGAIQKVIAAKLKKAGWLVSTFPAPNGWPDIRAFGGLRTMLIEVKRKGKKPSELQQYHIDEFRKKGYEVYVLDDTKEIDKIIKMTLADVNYYKNKTYKND